VSALLLAIAVWFGWAGVVVGGILVVVFIGFWTEGHLTPPPYIARSADELKDVYEWSPDRPGRIA
jgi:hypothetical protein